MLFLLTLPTIILVSILSITVNTVVLLCVDYVSLIAPAFINWNSSVRKGFPYPLSHSSAYSEIYFYQYRLFIYLCILWVVVQKYHFFVVVQIAHWESFGHLGTSSGWLLCSFGIPSSCFWLLPYFLELTTYSGFILYLSCLTPEISQSSKETSFLWLDGMK